MEYKRFTDCGVSDVALKTFLENYEVKILNFRLDNDYAGHEAVDKFTEKYIEKGYEVHAIFSKGKDINEDLMNRR